MNKVCKNCGSSFLIRGEDLKFLEKASPLIGGKKYDIPPPTFCPDCRQQRRLCWRNERFLYKRKCDATGQEIIANISPDKPYKVYQKDYWFSDKWDARKYGRDFDFSKTFAENFAALQLEVPRFPLQQPERMENSEYCNFASNCKNSYFLFDSDFCEDCLYSNVVNGVKDCMDCSFLSDCELCYECINCKNCYGLKFSQNCVNCNGSVFLEGCVGCGDCAFSTNLHNKQYYFKNKKYSKEEYTKKIEGLNFGMDEFVNFLSTQPRRFMQGTQNENVFGDYINNSRDVYRSFDIVDGWDIAYSELLFNAKDCFDISSFGAGIELMYECITAGLKSYGCAFNFNVVKSSHSIFYSDVSYSCKNCFGCVSLNHNEYCILNKQYTKKEYESLVAKIIAHMQKTGEWGEFLPAKLSPVAYNESVAFDYFPLTKDEVLKKGLKWKEKDKKDYKKQTCVVPDDIRKVGEEIFGETLACSDCGKNYKVVYLELRLCKKMGVPIPKLCPDCRHSNRVRLKNPRKLWERVCDGCGCHVVTSFSPERKEKILCEKCYLEEVE